MYMQSLRHLRDFLTEEELKFLPGRLHGGTFLLLEQNKGGKEAPFKRVLQVFTSTGTWIGEISEPVRPFKSSNAFVRAGMVIQCL